MLTGVEIASRGIVEGSNPGGERPTTYDATVGHIVRCGKEITGDDFDLPPRGIVWVVSAEIFNVPNDVTGLATLRTSWTHEGVLALNVGIVDPGWRGPLAAAIVNFNSSPFNLRKGDHFLRLVFNTHAPVSASIVDNSNGEYLNYIIRQSKVYSTTFLNMESLVSEVSKEIFTLPKLGLNLARAGILIAVLSILSPIVYSVFSDMLVTRYRVDNIEDRLKNIPTASVQIDKIEKLEQRVLDLEKEIARKVNPPTGSDQTQPGSKVGDVQKK